MALSHAEPILQVEHLTTRFRTDDTVVTAVDDVSFELYPGETLGIVGESGCGKTVTSKSIMKLLPAHLTIYGPDSRILMDGKNLLSLSERRMQNVRGNRIAMIFQEPMTALNPVFTVGWQLDETLKYHTKLDRRQRRQRTIKMLEMVEMPNPERRLREYPHQLSGGMRQRVMIAMALACKPGVLIADEPTTALDVTIQAQILRLMHELKNRIGTATLLITHDLGVVAQVCDRVLVMYAGRVVEMATVGEIFKTPRHPYTHALLESIPQATFVPTDRAATGQSPHQRLPAIAGVVPSLRNLPTGCRFHPRCQYCEPVCETDEPGIDETDEGRQYRCHFPLSY